MGFGIPKLFVAIVFGHEIHLIFLNLAKIHISIPKSTEEGGSIGLRNIPKKNSMRKISVNSF